MNFWTKLTQKGYFWSTKEKNRSHHRLYIFEVVLILRFSFNKQYWFFEIDFEKKEYFCSKKKLKNITIEIFIFELVEVPNSSINWQFLFFLDQICPSKVFPVQNRKSGQQLWILHFPISLDIKFHFKHSFFCILGPNFPPKKVNIIIDFCINKLI